MTIKSSIKQQHQIIASKALKRLRTPAGNPLIVPKNYRAVETLGGLVVQAYRDGQRVQVSVEFINQCSGM